MILLDIVGLNMIGKPAIFLYIIWYRKQMRYS
jgi:hypothetical protein